MPYTKTIERENIRCRKAGYLISETKDPRKVVLNPESRVRKKKVK